MGLADIKTREYMADPARFADVFNYAVYGGRQVIRKDELSPMDSTTVAAPFGAKGSTGVQRHRDGLRLWQIMRDNRAVYAVMGLENQTDVHYAMPVRNMLYDAMSYAGQVSGSKSARESARRSGAEYLSGFGKQDKLLPVVTLVVHFGTKPWDGPLSLRDMLAEHDEELLKLVPDYKVNIVEPSAMEEGEFHKFRTELGLVLGYIKHAGNKDALACYVEGDQRFRNIGAQSAHLINVVTDSEFKLEPGKERVDMCQAIKDMKAESYESGRADERRHMSKAIRDIADERRHMSKAIRDMKAESYESGRADERRHMSKAIKDMKAESYESGRVEGQKEGALDAIAGLVRDGLIGITEAAAHAGVSEDELQRALAQD